MEDALGFRWWNIGYSAAVAFVLFGIIVHTVPPKARDKILALTMIASY